MECPYGSFNDFFNNSECFVLNALRSGGLDILSTHFTVHTVTGIHRLSYSALCSVD